MARREAERLSGTGTILVGDVVVRTTHYEISVVADAEGSGPEGGVTIEGSIDISGMGEALVLAGPGPLTLRLEDGRRVVFTLVSTSGRMQIEGGLLPA